MKAAKVIGGGCLLVFGLGVGLVILAVWARGAFEVMSIEFDGVCIDAPEPGYEAEGGGEQITVWKRAGPQMTLQTRAHLRLDPAIVAAAYSRPGVFVPVSGTLDQYVRAEAAPGSRIVHVTFAQGSQAERESLLAGISFCPADGLDLKS